MLGLMLEESPRPGWDMQRKYGSLQFLLRTAIG